MVVNVHNIKEAVVCAVNPRGRVHVFDLPVDLMARMEPDVPLRPELQRMLTC